MTPQPSKIILSSHLSNEEWKIFSIKTLIYWYGKNICDIEWYDKQSRHRTVEWLILQIFIRFALSRMTKLFYELNVFKRNARWTTFGVYTLNFSWLTIWNFSWLPNAVHWNLPCWFARSLPVDSLEDTSQYLIRCFSVQLHHAFECPHQSPVIHIISSNLIILYNLILIGKSITFHKLAFNNKSIDF